MLKDLRKLPINEAALVLNKVLLHSNYKNTDIRFDDSNNDWQADIKLSDKSVFKAYGRGNVDDGITEDLYVEYSPPNAGSIVFILKVNKEENIGQNLLDSINELLAKYGGKGMNFVSSFENLSVYSERVKKEGLEFPIEIAKITSVQRTEWNWMQRLAMNILKVGNKF